MKFSVSVCEHRFRLHGASSDARGSDSSTQRSDVERSRDRRQFISFEIASDIALKSAIRNGANPWLQGHAVRKSRVHGRIALLPWPGLCHGVKLFAVEAK